jgi:hypothetical protein
MNNPKPTNEVSKEIELSAEKKDNLFSILSGKTYLPVILMLFHFFYGRFAKIR